MIEFKCKKCGKISVRFNAGYYGSRGLCEKCEEENKGVR